MSRDDVDRLVTLATGDDPGAVAALLRAAQREGDAAAVALGTLLAGGPEEATWRAATSVLEGVDEPVARRTVALCREIVAGWSADVRRPVLREWLPEALGGGGADGRGLPTLVALGNALVLENVDLDDTPAFDALVRSARRMAAPLHLELSHCGLTDTLLTRLLDAVAEAGVRSLSIRRNHITATGLTALVAVAQQLGLRALDLGENPLRAGTAEALDAPAPTLEHIVLPLSQPAQWTALATAPGTLDVESVVLERPLPRAPDGVEVWRAVERDPLLRELLVTRAGAVSRAERSALGAAGAIDATVSIAAPAGALVFADAGDVPLREDRRSASDTSGDTPVTTGSASGPGASQAGREDLAPRLRPSELGLRPRSAYTVRVTAGPLSELERVFLGDGRRYELELRDGIAVTGGPDVWSQPLLAGRWLAFVSAVRRDAAPSGIHVPDLVLQLLPVG